VEPSCAICGGTKTADGKTPALYQCLVAALRDHLREKGEEGAA
jgi:hypothetical protein